MSEPTYAYRAIKRGQSLSDRVADQLTEAILSRQLNPGDLLPPERELGDKFGVSRTVVREAVRSLAARGLVRVTSGRGVEVNAFGPGDVAASIRLLVRGQEELDYGTVNEVRSALEVKVAGLAAQRAHSDDLERLAQLCDDYQQSLDRRDLAAAGELDFQFHRELAQAAGNELLLAMLDSIADVLHEVRNQAMNDVHVGEEGLRAHRKILKCVSAGKPDDARAAMAAHLAEAERVWRGLRRGVARKKKA